MPSKLFISSTETLIIPVFSISGNLSKTSSGLPFISFIASANTLKVPPAGTPLVNLVIASEKIPCAICVLRKLYKLNVADSSRTFLVFSSIMVNIPPIAPAIATGISFEVINISLSIHSIVLPSSNSIFSPFLACLTIIFGLSLFPTVKNLS